MSGTISTSLPDFTKMSADQIGDYFGGIAKDDAKEDVEGAQARRALAILGWIATTLAKVKENLKSAEETNKANQDKADGGFWGAVIGIIIAIVIIVVVIVLEVYTVGLATPIVAALLGLAAACMGAGGSLGSAAGAKNAEDNEEEAAALKALADQLGLKAEDLMKLIEDLKAMVDDAQDVKDKIEEDERDRERANNNLAGL